MRLVKAYIIILSTLVLSAEAFAQNSILSLGVWNLTALSGELKAGGLYGYGTTNSYGIDNTTKTSSYYGGLMLKTSSYIWNPNFMILDIDGGYYPESRQDVYLVFQNHYDMINMQKLHIGATFFPKKPITLSTYLNYDNSYDNRENLTDIKTNSKNYGGTFGFANKTLPMSFAYNKTYWDNWEINTNRTFSYNQENLEGRMSKSFGISDKNDLIYTRHDYSRREFDLATPIRNISDNIELLDNFFLDSSKKSHFNSNILGTNQVGNDSFQQFRATENLYYMLPYNSNLNATYGYNYIARSIENLGLHSFNCILSNQLYESLHSALFYEYNNAMDSYHEINNKVGIDLTYTKKIPLNGLLTIAYDYSRMHEKHMSEDQVLHIMNEEYTLSDSRRTLLKRPFVDSASILIKDASGTTIYQNGLDYTLSSVGNFIEVQRVPGGLIADNTNVYIYYDANQPGSYSYDVNLNNLMVNVALFKRFLSLYYKYNHTGYENISMADYLLLDHLTENIYGARLEYKAIYGGVEYDDYMSSFVPYKMTRYYATFQGSFHRRFLYSINANWRDYQIPYEDEDRIYKDVSGLLSYSFSPRTKLDVNAGYQYQHGRQINLDLVTSRVRLTTFVKGFTVSGGIDYYNRVYLDNERISYIGGNLQIIKKFKY